MNVLDLAEELGLSPKRLASTKGGEYHSPCPGPDCGGKDRFCIWPKEGKNGRYWCRRCESYGDAIQFCRDFLGLSFKDACKKIGQELKINDSSPKFIKRGFEPISTKSPSDVWMLCAERFVKKCHWNLLKNHENCKLLSNRGLSKETISRYQIGYNSQTIWDQRTEWGMEEKLNDRGKPSKIWLPSGLVIPSFSKDKVNLNKIKIRRDEWYEGDVLPKYVEVSGSHKQFSVYGSWNLPVDIVEAELDAILVQQEAGNLCCSIALGGASKRPDFEVHQLMRKASKILFSLDFDDAGKNEYYFWKQTYSQLISWPAPLGKSPSEAFQRGVSLLEWVKAGLSRSLMGSNS